MSNHSNRLMRHYWSTYCGLALIPMLLLAIAFFLITQTNLDEAARSRYKSSAAQIAEYMDGVIGDMQGTADTITVSTFLSELEESANVLNRQSAEGKIVSFLENAQANCRMPAEALYYAIGDTFIYTAEAKISYEAFQSTHKTLADLNLSQFFINLNAVKTMKVWGLKQSTTVENPENRYVAFAFPVFSESVRKRGTLVYLIGASDLMAVAESYLGARPELFLLLPSNMTDTIVADLTAIDKQKQNALIRLPIDRAETLSFDSGQKVCLHTKTSRYGLHIILGVDPGSFYEGGRWHSLTGALLIIAALFAVVIIIGFFISRAFCRPMWDLISGLGEDALDGSKDEYTWLDRHMNNLQNEITALQERMTMQRPIVRDRLLQALLRGRIHESEIQQLKDVCPDLNLETGGFYIILIRAGDMSGDRLELLEKCALEGAEGYGVAMEGEHIFALIVRQPDTVDRRRAQYVHFGKLLAQRCIQNYRIGISGIVDDFQKLSEAFVEAYITLNKADEINPFIFHDEEDLFRHRENGWLMESVPSVNAYLQSMQSVDKTTALRLLHEVLNRMHLLCWNPLTIMYARYELYTRALGLHDRIGTDLPEQSDVIRMLSSQDEYEQAMKELTRQNCGIAEKKRGQARSDARQNILAAVRQHCCESDFSLSKLSILTGYSATYINRILREETGYSFIQYVSMLRIVRAKDLLKQTNLRIKDVVQQVGYIDMANFIRKFKEHEGVTPSEYRALNLKSE